MNRQFRTAAQLKAKARGLLLGRYGTAIGASVMRDLLMTGLMMVTYNVVDTNTVFGIVLYAAILFILGLIATTLVVGELTIYFAFGAGLPARVFDIFKGLKEYPDRIVLTGIALFVICYGWFAPAVVALFMYVRNPGSTYLILFVGLLVIAAFSSIYVSIVTSQSFYVLLDFPELTVTEIIKTSGRMMEGRKLALVRLYVSFIPMAILGFLSAGIGFIFIEPYFKSTLTAFYVDIVTAGESAKGTNIDLIAED